MPYRFENSNGDVIEVETEFAANEYRTREGFTELDDAKPTRRGRKPAASADE